MPASTFIGYPNDKLLTQKSWDKTVTNKSAIGIPYAFQGRVLGEVVCPVCGLFISQKKRKDFESFSGSEYSAHYAEHHQKRWTKRHVKWRAPVRGTEGTVYASKCGRYRILSYVTSDRGALEITFRGEKPTHCDSLLEAKNAAECDNNPNWMP